VTRRGYLDWLRGLAVLIMIEAHTLDSWTRPDQRDRPAYDWSVIVAGIGAPIFLFLAGVALALAAGSRQRAGVDAALVTRRALRRGLFIFALAFLFRLQSWVISGGPFPESLLKVDILNVMGVSMLVAAALWGLGRNSVTRAMLLGAAALLVAMLTPLVRTTPLLAVLPDPIEWYMRPFPGRTTFTLFPWSGFLLAGGVVGLSLDAARTAAAERRLNIALALIGPAVGLAGYAASFLPALYAETSFWTSSPTFFFVRLGILITAVPVAYVWGALWRGWSPVRELGLASLFVYWIHVEMVYGVVSTPLHRRLSLEQAAVTFAIFSMFLYGVVRLKGWSGWPGAGENRGKQAQAHGAV
jgi:uncharacterized membrane protein